MKSYATVDDFIVHSPAWNEELARLREILLETGLEETVKWGGPVYTHDGKNIVGIGGFKHYFGLWFFQGALLADKDRVLISAQAGQTKALRQMRLTSAKEINARRIKAYVKEAIQLAKQGIVIKPDRDKPLLIPAELTKALKKNAKAATAFERMSKSCRREYAEYISSAKQDETKQRRLDKILPMIQAGGGLNDKYRNC
jgi:uncharacterized protein YdeI (YjbR/CyaY-like superfamily)